MSTTANAALHLGLVCPDGTPSSDKQIKSKITTVQKTVQIIDYADVKVQKKLDETPMDLKEYVKFSGNATVAKDYAPDIATSPRPRCPRRR